ncbi:transposase family protein [Nocardiopsis algeriensis]|uniref:transposase family protein n=1 Tax=Nocardiopsis algeriensis TaxID=1478215 RepID=UPI003CCD7CD1
MELRLDATEVQVRRLRAGRGGRWASVSGKKKQDTMKATVVADHCGRTLWTEAMRSGRMHDVTAARTAGIDSCFRHFPRWRCCSMAGSLVCDATTRSISPT